MLGEILAKTEANYQNIHAFTALFHQKTTSAAAGTMGSAEASGRLFYARPRQMRWEYEKPEEQVFVANNQFAWLYVRAENQITLFDADKLFSSPLARTFFDGALGLKNHFDVTLESSRSTRTSAVLKLVPKQEDPSFQLIYLWIDLQSYRISRIESHDIVGNTNEITIESLCAALEPRSQAVSTGSPALGEGFRRRWPRADRSRNRTIEGEDFLREINGHEHQDGS